MSIWVSRAFRLGISRLGDLQFILPAIEPSERGGRQERRRGPLMEAGRTGGRSNAKDCADVVGVIADCSEFLRSCGPPQRA
jgi:hypothetical protein